MKNPDYEIYISNPEMRQALEREARRARNEAMHRFVITPLTSAGSSLLKRARQALILILTLANHHFYSPGLISGPELNRNTQPRS